MMKEFLKESLLLAAGKQAEELAEFLDSKKYTNEFLIAKKLDLTINQTRNILYRISEHGLVSYTRKKDKKKGWYTYFWKIEALKALEFLRDKLMERVEQVTSQIKSRETKNFYHCSRCNIEFNEENALFNDFTCIECGNILEMKDNTKLVRAYKKNLERLENQLSLLDSEIEKEKQNLDKKKEREARKVAKKKAAERAAKRKETAERKAKAKAAEKTTKKAPKPAKKSTGVKKKTSAKKTPKKSATKKTAKKSTKKPVSKSSGKKKKTAKKTSKKTNKTSKRK